VFASALHCYSGRVTIRSTSAAGTEIVAIGPLAYVSSMLLAADL